MEKKGTTLLVIGLMFSTLGLTVLSDYTILKYSALILGLALTIYSVFVNDKQKKEKLNE